MMRLGLLLEMMAEDRENDSRLAIVLPVVAYHRFKKQIRRKLVDLLNQYEDGYWSVAQTRKAIRQLLRDAYPKAYGVGGGVRRMAPEDRQWLDGVEKSEFEYLDGFFNDLRTNQGKMHKAQRLRQYSNKLDMIFWTGMVKYAKSTTRFAWHLNDADNCDDCIRLSDAGSYTRDTLPTVPGAGFTDCGQNCQCFLTVMQ